jgi:hypothetical protein
VIEEPRIVVEDPRIVVKGLAPALMVILGNRSRQQEAAKTGRLGECGGPGFSAEGLVSPQLFYMYWFLAVVSVLPLYV